MKELLQEGFKAWLETKPPSQYVGVQRDPRYCPIATYLNETSKPLWGKYVVKGYSYYHTGIFSWVEDSTPAWAGLFIELVDVGKHDDPVTAKEALTLLNSLEAA